MECRRKETCETTLRNRDMATIDYGFCDRSQIGVHEMSYDEFCIAAFGKDTEDLGKEKTTKNNNYDTD